MAMTFTQTDTLNLVSGSKAWCTGLTAVAQGVGPISTQGGSAGSAGITNFFGAASSASNVTNQSAIEITVPSGTSWDAGTWTVRYNVTTSNMNLTINGVYICHVDSAYNNIATIGSATGLSVSLGTTGVKTQSISGSAITPSAGDKVMIAFGISNGAMSFQGATLTPSQNIDSPFTLVTPSLVWDTLSAIRHLLVRKVFDFGRLAPAWSRRPSGLIVPRAVNDDNIKLAA